SGVELGDQQASGISLDVWSRALTGKLPAGVMQTELSRPRDDAQGRAQVLLAEGVRQLAIGHPDRAADVFREALETARRAAVRNAYTTPNMAWLATALREQAQQPLLFAPQRRRALIREATRAARQAVRTARLFANDLPHALRE